MAPQTHTINSSCYRTYLDMYFKNPRYDKKIEALSEGVDLKGVDLHFAVILNSTVTVGNLLNNQNSSNKIDVNQKDAFGYTPLHLACYSGLNMQIIQILLDSNCDVDLQDRFGFSALHYVVSVSKNINLIKLLLNHGCNTNLQNNINNFTVLHTAISDYSENSDNSKEIVELLLDSGCDTSLFGGFSRDITALHMATYKKCVEIVKLLLNNGCDINLRGSNGYTALHFAVFLESIEIVKLLLDYESNSLSTNKKASSHCINIQDTLFGSTPLHIAIGVKKNIEIVKLLLNSDYNIDINIQNTISHHTPLHLAVIDGSFDIVKLLLEKKCDLNIQTSGGYTALHLAIIHFKNTQPSNINIVKLLLEHNSDTELCNNDGNDAFYFAIYKANSAEITQLLLNTKQTKHNAVYNAAQKVGSKRKCWYKFFF